MKKIIFYSAIAAGLLISSCNKRLDITNPNQFTVDVFYKTESDAIKGVNAIYSTLHRGAISRWMFFLTVTRSDEGQSRSPATDLRNNFDQFLVTDYNWGPTRDVWRENYVGIFRANQVLDNVPGINMNDALKQRVLGEAKFLRALFYYNLASLWGNVPLQLSTSKPTDLPPTSTQADVWAQVEKDLTDAAAVLPTAYPNAADLGRATKGAAYALLAKALMQEKKFSQALTPLKWLVEEEGRNIYDLMPDYRSNFLITAENNKESVFEWQFAENLNDRHDDDVRADVGALNYGTSLAQFFSPVGWSDGEARRWTLHEFNEKTTTGQRDPRVAATFLFDSLDERGPRFTMIYGQTFAQRYPLRDAQGNIIRDANGNIVLNPNDSLRIWHRKFLNDHWKNEEGYRSPNNYRFIRYADVLLMYAESLNETGATTQAYQYVDRVRQRAGLERLTVVKPGLSQAQFRQQIKHERITELTGEGHRWNDLARWGELGPELVPRDPGFANFIKGKHEFLPVPQVDVDINPFLDQNPNW
jgi:hypothetical protein